MAHSLDEASHHHHHHHHNEVDHDNNNIKIKCTEGDNPPPPPPQQDKKPGVVVVKKGDVVDDEDKEKKEEEGTQLALILRGVSELAQRLERMERKVDDKLSQFNDRLEGVVATLGKSYEVEVAPHISHLLREAKASIQGVWCFYRAVLWSTNERKAFLNFCQEIEGNTAFCQMRAALSGERKKQLTGAASYVEFPLLAQSADETIVVEASPSRCLLRDEYELYAKLLQLERQLVLLACLHKKVICAGLVSPSFCNLSSETQAAFIERIKVQEKAFVQLSQLAKRRAFFLLSW